MNAVDVYQSAAIGFLAVAVWMQYRFNSAQIKINAAQLKINNVVIEKSSAVLRHLTDNGVSK